MARTKEKTLAELARIHKCGQNPKIRGDAEIKTDQVGIWGDGLVKKCLAKFDLSLNLSVAIENIWL